MRKIRGTCCDGLVTLAWVGGHGLVGGGEKFGSGRRSESARSLCSSLCPLLASASCRVPHFPRAQKPSQPVVTPLLPDNWEHLRTQRIRGENRSIFIFCAIVPQVSWSSPATSLLLLLRPWRRSKPRGFPFAFLPPSGAARSSVESGTIVRRTGGTSVRPKS